MLLTIQEVADRLRLSVTTIRRFLKSGRLHGQKVGKKWRVSEEALAAFLALDSPADSPAGD